MTATDTIRVLVVDDSQFIRHLLTDELEKDPRITVVAHAKDAFEARDYIVRLKPHVMTLDVEMPKMDGVTFVKRLMPQWPMPVIMVSSENTHNSRITISALEAGALDFVAKPSSLKGRGIEAMIHELRLKIHAAFEVDQSHWKRTHDTSVIKAYEEHSNRFQRTTHPFSEHKPELIAIGASTGGPQALHHIIQGLPATLPPIVVTQHMPAGFTKLFAERLNDLSDIVASEAEDGQELKTGMLVVAPGGRHTEVVRNGDGAQIKIRNGELVNGHKPSCDPLFRSCIPFAPQCLGIILTGMGDDGGAALKSLRSAGAFTIGQDEASSVVFGMPCTAMEYGAISLQLSLDQMAPTMIRICQQQGNVNE